MSKRWFAVILLVIFLLGVAALTLVFRQALREYVVLPLVLFWQKLERFYQSLSPDMVWAGFLVLAYFFTVLSFPRLQSVLTRPLFGSQSKQRYQLFAEAKPDQEHPGRLVFWVNEVGRMYRDHMCTRLSVLELKKLVLGTIAFRESMDGMYEAERWLEEYQQRVPPAVMELLHVKPLVRTDKGCNPLAALWMRLQIWLRDVETPVEETPSEKIAIILKYLEQDKEVKHDHRTI